MGEEAVLDEISAFAFTGDFEHEGEGDGEALE